MPTHAEKRFMPHTPEQLFDLVADIERYPEFLPWCTASRIRERQGDTLRADLVIGFKVFRERFASTVTFDRPERINVRYDNGPFRHLNNHWVFIPAEGGCVIDFYVDFEFRSRLLHSLIGAVFNEAVRRMVTAFEARAGVLYAPENTSVAMPPEPEGAEPDRV